jgi:aquaporin related protein
VLGSVVAAGFYKFIKILEYETANPDQDMDHAAKVQRKKNLLIAAGINEVDAQVVASELQQAQARAETQEGAPSTANSEKTAVEGGGVGVGHGGPDPKVLANGQGRNSLDGAHREAMYGTAAFRGGSTSSGSDRNVHEGRPGGPGLVGRYSYLGRAGLQPSAQGLADRTDSPAIASPNDAFTALNEPDVALGGMVANEPRNRFARTASSGV